MPTRPTVPPHDRIFAHIEKFECACPGCGQVMQVRGSQHYKPAKTVPVRPINKRLWNPVTQRLKCPICHAAFAVGLLFYPLAARHPLIEPPPDVLKTRRERLEARRLAGGWVMDTRYRPGDPVNLYVPASCSCPERGWASDCPVHGQTPPDTP
jgi:hypothetical protein